MQKADVCWLLFPSSPLRISRTVVFQVSIETGSVVEWTAEENYKFRLSAFQDRLIEWLESSPAGAFFDGTLSFLKPDY